MKRKKSTIYLDYAAATPLDWDVLKAMAPYFADRFHNPSANYLAARGVKQDLGDARGRVAGHLGAKPAEIIFTAGATEANNLAIQGVMKQYPQSEVLVSAIEHESVLAPARLFKHREIPVDDSGLVDPDLVEKMIKNRTVLISVGLVNNELGTVQALAALAHKVAKIRRQRQKSRNSLPLYLHTDAAQAGNYFDLHVSRLGVDLLSLNGGKIYGPKQSGALFVKTSLKLRPLIEGGGQERGLRAGTENVPAIIGLAAALDQAQALRAEESHRISGLRDAFERQLKLKLPRARLNGSAKMRAPHIVSVSLPGSDNERLMMQLDEHGVIAAVGSACSASRDEASHVLSAIGLSDDTARSSLRFSFGRGSKARDIKKVINLLVRFGGD